MKKSKKLQTLLLMACLVTSFFSTRAQVSSVNESLAKIKQEVQAVNQQANNNDIYKAVSQLDKINDYFKRYIGNFFDDEYRKAKTEDPSYRPKLQVSFSKKLTAAYWEERVKRSRKSLDLAKQAFSESYHRRTLDKQDKVWAYLKTTYEAAKTMKDVAESVGELDYGEAVKNAKEGVDGFIENYKKIEESRLQILNTKTYETDIRGLIRRAEKMEEANWKFASYLRVYEKHVDDFYRIKGWMDDQVNRINKEQTVDWSLYFWDPVPPTKKINEIQAEHEEGKINCETLKAKINTILQSEENREVGITNKIYKLKSPDIFKKANKLDEDFESFRVFANKTIALCKESGQAPVTKEVNTTERTLNIQNLTLSPPQPGQQSEIRFTAKWEGPWMDRVQMQVLIDREPVTDELLTFRDNLGKFQTEFSKNIVIPNNLEAGTHTLTLQMARDPHILNKRLTLRCPAKSIRFTLGEIGNKAALAEGSTNKPEDWPKEETNTFEKETDTGANDLFKGAKAEVGAVSEYDTSPSKKVVEKKTGLDKTNYGKYWEKTLPRNTKTEWYFRNVLSIKHLVDGRSICYQTYYDPELKFLANEWFHENFAIKHGPYRHFEKDRVTQKVWLSQTGYYKLNKAVGPWVKYNADQSIASVSYYIDGEKVEPRTYKLRQQQDLSLPPPDCYQNYDWFTVRSPEIKEKPELITMNDFRKYRFNYPDKYGLKKYVKDCELRGAGTKNEDVYYSEIIYADNNIRQEIGKWYWYLTPNGKKIHIHLIKFGNLEVMRRNYLKDGYVKELLFMLNNSISGTAGSNSKTFKIGPHYKKENGKLNVAYYDGKGHKITRDEYAVIYKNNQSLPSPDIYKDPDALKYPEYIDYPTDNKQDIDAKLIKIGSNAILWKGDLIYNEFRVEYIVNHELNVTVAWKGLEHKTIRYFHAKKGFYRIFKSWYPNGQLKRFYITPQVGQRFSIEFDEQGILKKKSKKTKNFDSYKKYIPNFTYPELDNSYIITSIPELKIPEGEITPLYLAYIEKLKNPTVKTNIDQLIISQSDNTQPNLTAEIDNYQQLQREEFVVLSSKIQKIIDQADKSFNKPYWENKNAPRTTVQETNPKQESFTILLRAVPIAGSAKYKENQAALYYLLAMKFAGYSGRVFGNKGKQQFFGEAAKLVEKADFLIPRLKASNDKTELSELYCTSAGVWREMTRKALWGNHQYNKMYCDKKVLQQYEKAVQADPGNQKAKRILENLKAPKKPVPAVVQKFEKIPDETWNKAQQEMIRLQEEKTFKELNKKPEINALEVAVMTLEFLEGTVSILRSGAAEWEKVTDSRVVIYNGDRIKTSADARGVSITYTDDHVFLAIKNSAEVEIVNETYLMIRRGDAYVQVERKGRKFLVYTPTCAVGVRGTEFEIQVADDKTTETFLYKGVVELRNGTDIGYLIPGQKMKAGTNNLKLEQSKFNVAQRKTTRWANLEQQQKIHRQILAGSAAHSRKKGPPVNKAKSGTATSTTHSFKEFWSLNTYSNTDSFRQSVTAKTKRGFVPVGLNCNGSKFELLYLGGGVLKITAWNMEWYNDANSLQNGVNKNMNRGYIPTGFSWNGKAYYVFYIKTDFTGTAWRIVPASLNLQAVSSAIQPFIEQNYVPMGITVIQNQYYTLLVQFTEPLAKKWSIEGYYDNKSAITKGVNAKLPEGSVPWGILKNNGTVNILFVGL